MTTAAKNTFGNKVFMNPAPAAPILAVAELLNIDPPGSSRDMQDATTMDSPGGAEEIIPEGTYKPGQMKLTVNYIARSIGDLAFTLAMTTATLQNVKLQVKTATGFEDQTFSGYVSSYAPDGQGVKGKQTARLVLDISGPVTKAATV